MINFITSIPTRISSFVSRNKFKLAFSGLAIGGAYYYYRDTIWQMVELYQLMKQMENQDEKFSSDKKKLDEGLVRIIATGDETAQKHLKNIRTELLIELYGVDITKVQESLRNAKSNSDKESWFSELNVLSFSRLVSSIIFFHLIHLLARVEVCLIGRSNRSKMSSVDNEEDRRIDHRELLSALRILGSKEIVDRVDSVSREIIRKVFLKNQIVPTASIKADRLISVLDQIVNEIVSGIRGDGWSWLLGSLETSSSSPIVCETLDVLESPQFTQVISFLIRNDCRDAVIRSLTSLALTDKANIKVAVLIPGVRNEPDNIFCVNGGPYHDRLCESPIVTEFCQSVYFADHAETDSSSSSDNNSSSSQAEMEAKLGQLLQRLVTNNSEEKV